MKFIFLFMMGTGCLSFGSSFACPAPAAEALENSLKLLVVVTPSWNQKQGTLRLWERTSITQNWTSSEKSEPIVLGENGVAWGYLFKNLAKNGEPLKQEGDGRTPVGIHRLGKKFGLPPLQAPDALPLTASTFCVDDPASKFYNSIVDATQVSKDWTSAEDMSKIDLYKLGIDIRYKSSAVEKAGSCLFLHIWRAPDEGTAGCVSMAEPLISRLHSELPADANPTLAILPSSEWVRFSPCFKGVTPN